MYLEVERLLTVLVIYCSTYWHVITVWTDVFTLSDMTMISCLTMSNHCPQDEMEEESTWERENRLKKVSWCFVWTAISVRFLPDVDLLYKVFCATLFIHWHTPPIPLLSQSVERIDSVLYSMFDYMLQEKVTQVKTSEKTVTEHNKVSWTLKCNVNIECRHLNFSQISAWWELIACCW